MVHRALELAVLPPGAGAHAGPMPPPHGPHARRIRRRLPELTGLELGDDEYDALVAECGDLVDRYFPMEDPTRVHADRHRAAAGGRRGHLALRGIIDRLDLASDGELVVVDYKTGRAPIGRLGSRGASAGVQLLLRSSARRCSAGARSPMRLMYLRIGRDDRGRADRASRCGSSPAHHGRVAGGRAGVPGRATSAPVRARCATRAASSGGARRSAASPTEPRPRPPGVRHDRSLSRDVAAAEIPRDATVERRPAVGPPQVRRGRRGLGTSSCARRHRRLRPVGRRALERIRGNPVADSVFVAASTLGDFSLIWHLVSRRPRPDPERAGAARRRCSALPRRREPAGQPGRSSGCSSAPDRPPRAIRATRSGRR